MLLHSLKIWILKAAAGGARRWGPVAAVVGSSWREPSVAVASPLCRPFVGAARERFCHWRRNYRPCAVSCPCTECSGCWPRRSQMLKNWTLGAVWVPNHFIMSVPPVQWHSLKECRCWCMYLPARYGAELTRSRTHRNQAENLTSPFPHVCAVGNVSKNT